MRGYFDAVEPTLQGAPFIEPVPDFEDVKFYFWPGPLIATVDIILGYEEGEFTFSGLTEGDVYGVTVTISDMDEFDGTGPVRITTDATNLDPVIETVIVSGNGKELGAVSAIAGDGDSQTVTTFLGTAKVSGSGEITIGFNEFFSWDPLAFPPFLEPGIRVEQIVLTPGHLVIKKTDVKAKNDIPKAKHDIDVKINVQGPIATDGSDGAFGYGILTSGGTNVVALTTHAGIQDHSSQTSAADAIWHAHVLDLALPTHSGGTLGDTCPVNAEFVVDFASSISSGNNIDALYDVKVKGKNAEKIEVKKIPVADVADAGVEAIVSFTIIPDGTFDTSTIGLGTTPSPLPFLCIDIP